MRNIPLIAIFFLAVSGCGRSEPERVSETQAAAEAQPAAPEASATARAELAPTQGNNVVGMLTLAPGEGGVQVIGQLTGLAPGGIHGIHIHENGDCSAPDGESAGDHFAPLQHSHGAPGPASHVGDLGNIEADAQGVARVDVKAVLATLGTGAATDVLGKAIIVHAKQDDLQSQPAGDSGARIACGVIS